MTVRAESYSFLHTPKQKKAFFPRSWRLKGVCENGTVEELLHHDADCTFDEHNAWGHWNVMTCTRVTESAALHRYKKSRSETRYTGFILELDRKGNSSYTDAMVAGCFDIYGDIKRPIS